MAANTTGPKSNSLLPSNSSDLPDVTKQRSSRLFMILGGFFIANAIVAEMIGVKTFGWETTFGYEPLNFKLFGQEGALQSSAGVLLWPIVFVMTDLLNEYYGRRGDRNLTPQTCLTNTTVGEESGFCLS